MIVRTCLVLSLGFAAATPVFAEPRDGVERLRAQLIELGEAEAKALQVLVRADRQVSVSGQLQAQLQQGQISLRGKLTTELDTLRASVDAFNETVVSVPIEVLRLARTQFDFLSAGFARKGDVISQAMSEIGGFAIDQALTVKKADPA